MAAPWPANLRAFYFWDNGILTSLTYVAVRRCDRSSRHPRSQTTMRWFSQAFPSISARPDESARPERAADVFAAAPVGIAVATLEGRSLDFNEAFHVLLGYSREELKRIPFATLTHSADAGRETRLLKRLL